MEKLPINQIGDSQNHQRSKIKKIIILSILIILFAVGFFIYYKYYAKGTLEIKSKTPGVSILVNGEEYNNVDEIKIKLTPERYKVRASWGNDYLESIYDVNIKALKKTVLDVNLSRVAKIADIEQEEISLANTI